MSLYDKMATSHPSLTRARVWCHTCGTTFGVNVSRCLAQGWPKCCGETMSIDSPAERAALEAGAEGGR